MELSQKVFNFTEDQDLKIRVGYDVARRQPYGQLRENNWTLDTGKEKERGNGEGESRQRRKSRERPACAKLLFLSDWHGSPQTFNSRVLIGVTGESCMPPPVLTKHFCSLTA